MALPAGVLERLREALGLEFVRTDEEARADASLDGLERDGHLPDAVVFPATPDEVALVLAECTRARVPVVPRGAGTGYSGGAIPVHGGVVLAMRRFDRIIEIDAPNLLACVEPNVITGALQAAVETHGLFYPPDPASLDRCSIGGNIAACAGGPRAFKYGTTRRYVLGLEAVLPTGEIVRTGSKCVKHVVGYDLTQLIVGSEGTLAVVTKAWLRLIPKPEAVLTLRATFPDVASAAAAVTALVADKVVPATLELIDGDCVAAVARHLGTEALAPPGTAALLLIDLDGHPAALPFEADRVEQACRRHGASAVDRAAEGPTRDELWRVRRELSPALKRLGGYKINNDVVVPRARVPELFAHIARLRATYGLPIPAFGHAGDGNIHVNIMLPGADDPDMMRRGRAAERDLIDAVLSLEGSLSGEHGIGTTKARFLPRALDAAQIALMRRLKQAFDPAGILNPGKIFPQE